MADKKKRKLPKQVLGVKIPKELRKAGGQVLEKANSPAGREMIAGALTMAAAAATAAVAKARAAEPAARGEGTQRAPDPAAFADVLGQAAEAALGRFFGKPRA